MDYVWDFLLWTELHYDFINKPTPRKDIIEARQPEVESLGYLRGETEAVICILPQEGTPDGTTL